MGKSQGDIPVIGIVGGVGAGKSTVAAELGRLGAAVIDADALGHQVLQEPQVRQELRRRWGDGVLLADGQVDRAAVARIVFADRAELEALNRITHGRIRQEIQRRIPEASAAGAPMVVLDAAVLFEAGWDDLCTGVVFVEAGEELRRLRAQAGKGWDEPTWRRREGSQISLDNKRRNCDYILDNSSDASCLQEKVRRLFQDVIRTAGRPR